MAKSERRGIYFDHITFVKLSRLARRDRRSYSNYIARLIEQAYAESGLPEPSADDREEKDEPPARAA